MQWLERLLRSQRTVIYSLVESYRETSKIVFTASLLGAQHEIDSAKKTLASFVVPPLGWSFNGTLRFLCAIQLAGTNILPVAMTQCAYRHTNRT